MKAILPIFCRPLGYVILIIALFIPFILAMLGMVTDNNLLFYKECTKLLMMAGALMILLALNKDESPKVEQIRIRSMRQAIYITLLFVFGSMLYRVAIRVTNTVDGTSFLIFMIINILCLEFGIARDRIDAIFKR